MTTDAAARISDTDREAVASLLSTALGEGRLTVAEYDERLQDAYRATTAQDLETLTVDLPVPTVEAEAADRSEQSHHWRNWIGMSLFFVALWAWGSIQSGHLLFFWPLFIILFSGIGMGCWRPGRK